MRAHCIIVVVFAVICADVVGLLAVVVYVAVVAIVATSAVGVVGSDFPEAAWDLFSRHSDFLKHLLIPLSKKVFSMKSSPLNSLLKKLTFPIETVKFWTDLDQ